MAFEAVNQILPVIMIEEKINSLTQPQISITKIAPKNPVLLKASFVLMPEIELADYKKIAKSIEESCKSADAILVLTEWEHFKKVNPDSVKDLVKNKVVIDSRNILDKKQWIKSGFNFIGNGWQ
jgi:UDPglucose 6-dehydrogenase